MSKLLSVATAAALALTTLPAAATTTNLIANGDFEAGFSDFTTDFTYTQINCCAGSAIVAPHINKAFSNNNNQGSRGGDHTTGSGLALFVNGSTNSTQVFWRQDVATVAGETYDFSAWGMIWFGSSVTTELRVNGASVGTYVIERFNALDTWAQDTLSFDAVSDTSTLELINVSTGFSGNDFAVDDLVLTGVSAAAPIPLPLPAALLAGGLLGLGALRRLGRDVQ